MATSRLQARAANGRVYVVVYLQREIATRTLQGRDSIPGMREYRLEDGRPLKAIDSDTFEVAGTGERLTRSTSDVYVAYQSSSGGAAETIAWCANDWLVNQLSPGSIVHVLLPPDKSSRGALLEAYIR